MLEAARDEKQSASRSHRGSPSSSALAAHDVVASAAAVEAEEEEKLGGDRPYTTSARWRDAAAGTAWNARNVQLRSGPALPPGRGAALVPGLRSALIKGSLCRLPRASAIALGPGMRGMYARLDRPAASLRPRGIYAACGRRVSERGEKDRPAERYWARCRRRTRALYEKTARSVMKVLLPPVFCSFASSNDHIVCLAFCFWLFLSSVYGTVFIPRAAF